MTGWLSIDPEIVYAHPTWELEDRETGMRARGDTYLQTHQQLRQYVDEYDSYEAWLNSHGSVFEQLAHRMQRVSEATSNLLGRTY